MMHYSAPVMGAKKPLYQIGDLIATYYEIDGDWRCELGYITGLEHRPPNTHVCDWWYYVRLIAGPEQVDHADIPETDIAGRVIHGTQG